MSFVAALMGFFKFYDEVVWLIKLLQKTPEEKHQELMQRVTSVFDESANGGRPGDLKSFP